MTCSDSTPRRAAADKALNAAAWKAILFITAAVLLAACSSSPDPDEPPTILYGEDVCDRCMMIINEARFATAYTTNDGQTRRFDDIGGMARHDRDMNEDVATYWVHDYETEEWLKADTAFFVKDDKLHTPMGFGIIAFNSQERAESWAAEQGGTMMTFSDIMAADELSEDSDHQQDS